MYGGYFNAVFCVGLGPALSAAWGPAVGAAWGAALIAAWGPALAAAWGAAFFGTETTARAKHVRILDVSHHMRTILAASIHTLGYKRRHDLAWGSSALPLVSANS